MTLRFATESQSSTRGNALTGRIKKHGTRYPALEENAHALQALPSENNRRLVEAQLR